MKSINRLLVLVLTIAVGLVVPTIMADGGNAHQQRTQQFGSSGGNVNDRSKAFCCSGTLGALLSDGTNRYILSNNHVLGISGKATAGDDITQPGLIDNGCRIATIVGDFTTAPALGPSNVDAAIAQLRTGTMDATGSIIDIGTISSVVKPASIGLPVAKSGRTTGFTRSTVGSINATISVQYQQGCGGGKKFTVTFRNQVVVNGGNFSAGGDSGSLIVSDDACHQPVALLYAGSSTSTIGNPIGEVLSQVGSSLGRSVSFVGDNCSSTQAARVAPQGHLALPLADETVNYATEVMNSRLNNLMSRPAVLGVGIGASDNDGAAAIVIYVDKTSADQPRLPKRIKDVEVQVVYTDPFIAY